MLWYSLNRAAHNQAQGNDKNYEGGWPCLAGGGPANILNDLPTNPKKFYSKTYGTNF